MAQTASSPPAVFHKPASRNLAMLRVAQMLALRNGQYPAQSSHFRMLEKLIPSKHRFCLALLLHQLLANRRADTSQCRLHHCAGTVLVYLHDLHLIRTRLQRYCSFNAIRFSNTDIYEYRYFCYSYRNGQRIGQQQRRRRRSRSRGLFE